MTDEPKAVPPTSLDGSTHRPASLARAPAASFDEPRRFRKYTSLSAMKAGEGSLRGLFSLTRGDKPAYNGSSVREVDFLRDEVRAAQEAVKTLEAAVRDAQSFREKSSKMLEEAHRALGRLEQAVSYNSDDRSLINVACEIKCVAQRGVTLVNVYGKYSTLVKVATVFLRSYIHSKFDKQAAKFKSLITAEVARAASMVSALPQPSRLASLGGAASVGGASTAPNGGLSSPSASLAAGSVAGLTVTASMQLPPLTSPSTQQPCGGGTGSLQRNSQSAAHPQAPGSGPIVGTVVRQSKHDRVHAMAYVPGTQNDYVCLWWSAGQMLEFYSGAMQSATGFPIEKPSLNVTAVAVDDAGNVWTGHAKGLVRVRSKQTWEYIVEERAFSSAVKAMTFDEMGRAWVGDDGGRIKVLGYDPRAGRLETVASLQRSPALLAKMKVALADNVRGLFGKRHCGGSSSSQAPASPAAAATVAGAFATATAAAAAAAAGGQQASLPGRDSGTAPSSAGSSTGGQAQPVAIEGPVRCIFLRGGRAWTSGGGRGGSGGWLQMWDASSFQGMDVYDCCAFGPCHAMASLRWPSGALSAGPSVHPPVMSPAASGGAHHRYTHSDGGRLYGAAAAAAAAAAPSSGGGYSWRLLTGHENGQLLLWHPEHSILVPLLRIGEASSPCRGIAVFDCCRLLATAHQNGELHLFVQPTSEGSLPPGANSAAPSTFGIVRPRMVTIQAHRSRMDRMIFSTTSCITASNLGTIRLWYATELAAEAHRQGLLTHTASYGSLAASAIGAAGGGGGGTAGGSSMSKANSMQPRHTGSTSLGELAPVGSLQYTPSQYVRDSAKRMGSASELRDGRASGQGGDSAIAAAIAAAGTGADAGAAAPSGLGTAPSVLAAVSSGFSPASQPSMQSQQMQRLMPTASLSTGASGPVGETQHQPSRHRRDSRDSVEAGGALTGTQSRQSSGNTATGDVGGSAAPLAQMQTLAGAAAGIPHFQTIDASELCLKDLIGSGAYGKVWLAEWTGCQVAVKELFGLQGGQAGREKEYSALVNEVTLLGSLSHPNIMRFLAVVPDPPFIVMQYYPHGSLFDLLSRARRGSAKAAKELSWGKRLDMLRDVAAGMQYLHSRKPPVIHGDLRSPNLLLDLTIDRDRPRFHVKIADFGLARMATGATGSVAVSKSTNPRWTAPEVIHKGSLGKAADVFSFGIIMWEMLCWQQPYEDMLTVQVMYNTVVENSRPEVPPDSELPGSPGITLPQYRELMESCWHADASTRPSFKQVVEHFQVMQQAEAENARQQRQQQLQQLQQPSGNGRRSRGPSETGGSPIHIVAGSPGVAAGAVDVPGSGGSGAGGEGALATPAGAPGGAAQRRPGGGGVASPFSQPAGFPTAPGTSPAEAAHLKDGALAQAYAQQQYGSLLSLYGMSPILEEQMSYSSTAGAAAASAGAAPAADAGARVAVAGQQLAGPAAEQQQQEQQQVVSQPHVHFAPSAFAADAAAPPSFSSPPSPALVSRPRAPAAAARPHPHPPSSSSSAESAAPPHPVSGGSNGLAGAASNPSSRHSSASASGRTAGTAPAPPAAGPGGWRRPGSAAGGGAPAGRAPTAAPGQGAGTGTGAARRDGGTHAGGPSAGTAARAPVRRTGSVAGSGRRPSATGEPHAPRAGSGVYEHHNDRAAGVTAISPFAAYPSGPVAGEDGASGHHTHHGTLYHPAAVAHAATASPFATSAHDEHPHPRHHSAAGTAGGGRGTAAGTGPSASGAAGRAAGRMVSSGSAHPAASGGSFRARGHGPSLGPGPPSYGTHGAAGRGAASRSQPGTPSYRGPAGTAARPATGSVAPDGRSSGGRSGIPTAALIQTLLTMQRDADAGESTAPASPAYGQRSNSGEPPASVGSRTPAASSRAPSVTSGYGPSGGAHGYSGQSTHAGAHPVHPVGSGSMPRRALPHSLSQSAVHAHVSGYSAVGSASVGAHDSRPGHQRTPSGGSGSGLQVVTSAGASRGRDLAAARSHTTSDVASPTRYATGAGAHPRTPTAAARSGRASPRVATSGAAAAGPPPPPLSRANGVRRNNSNLAPTAAASGGTYSPSAPSSVHLSRLGAGASGRHPASPRAHGQGGVTVARGNSEEAGGVGSGSHAPVSRIPTLQHGIAPGVPPATAAPPVKSDTCRSLDDANLRRLGLVEAASGLSPAVSSSMIGSPAAVAASGAVASPFAVAASAVWDDGLGVRLSPEVTEDIAYQPSADYPRLQHEDDVASPAAATRGSGPSGPLSTHRSAGASNSSRTAHATASPDLPLLPLPPLPPRIMTSRPTVSPSTQSATASWEPPPLLTSRAVGGVGSPFAVAAFTSPFHANNVAAGRPDDSSQDTDLVEPQRTSNPSGNSADVTEARTSPIAPQEARASAAAAVAATGTLSSGPGFTSAESGRSGRVAGFGSLEPLHRPSAEWAVDPQPTCAPVATGPVGQAGTAVAVGAAATARGPFAAVASTASPFSGEGDSWWGDQHHHHDD